MKRFSSFAAIGLSFLAGVVTISASSASAATANAAPGTGQALEIAPPLIILKANPGQTITTKIQLRDVSRTDLLVTNQINDFVAAGEDGTPKIITGDDSNNPFSILGWINPLPSFTLAPQHIQNLSMTISVPAHASPGGHYGVIRFTGTPPQLKGQGVSLSASLGALVLLTVNGKINDKLAIQQFATTKVPSAPSPSNPKPASTNEKPLSLFQTTPLNFEVRLKNNGNVQEQPVGHILVSNMFGKAVTGVNVNLARGNVLPTSTRKFDSPLDSQVLGGKKLFGRYHAALTVKYGPKDSLTAVESLYFWVIPWKLILAVIVLLIAGFFFFRKFIRHYNQRIISRAQGPESKSKSKNKKK